jgi:CRP-like cAMP-binding protein
VQILSTGSRPNRILLCRKPSGRGLSARIGILLRGGVVSERHVHPRGRRPRPTGRDIKVTNDPLANRLLADLPRSDFDLIRSHLSIGPFARGTVLAESGDEIDQVYFPLFGGTAAFGLHKSKVRGILQVPIVAATLSASQLRRVAGNSRVLYNLCIGFNEVLLSQARVTAACNALHMIEARFCRWLLQTSEVSGSRTVTLTQEFLAEMLGVRRTSVTEVATKLQSAGLISYSRGVINILDDVGLREKSCECFETLREQRAT